MSNLFIAGIGGILLTSVISTMLMLMNVEAQSYPAEPCTFSSGYGVGVKACEDSLTKAASTHIETFAATQD